MLLSFVALNIVSFSPQIASDQGLNQLAERLRTENKLPNLYVTVVLNGRVYAAATGFQDEGQTVKAKVENQYRIGSVTKPLTSTLVLRLASAGKINLDTHVINFFPEAKSKAQPEFLAGTVRNLLTHTFGLSSPGTGPFRSRRKEESESTFGVAVRRECIEKWFSESPAGPRGEYKYSNNGYCILGSICELVGGKPFDELIAKEVFAPLGMSGAGVGMPSKTLSESNPWYFPHKDGRAATPFPPIPGNDQGPTTPSQGGAYWDSASAGRFILETIRLYGGESRFLPRELSQMMFSPQLGQKSRTAVWETWQEGRFGIAFTHNGANSDQRGAWNCSHIRIVPKAKFGMSVTTTAGFSGDFGRLCNTIQQYALGQS
jgi:CubicO group peptidase (beta-lactamase class C family)